MEDKHWKKLEKIIEQFKVDNYIIPKSDPPEKWVESREEWHDGTCHETILKWRGEAKG